MVYIISGLLICAVALYCAHHLVWRTRTACVLLTLSALCCGSAMALSVLMTQGCESAPVTVESVRWSGEGSVDVGTSAGEAHVSIAYVGLLDADGEAVHCPLISVRLSGALSVSLYGVPPSSEDARVDALCYQALGALAVRVPENSSPD